MSQSSEKNVNTTEMTGPELEHLILQMKEEWWESIYICCTGFVCQFLSQIILFFLGFTCYDIILKRNPQYWECFRGQFSTFNKCYPTKELLDMSNLSTTSAVSALNLVGMDIQNSIENMQKCIKKGLHKINPSVEMDIWNSFKNLQKCMEKGLYEIKQSIKDLGNHNQDLSLMLTKKYNTSFIDDGVEYGAS